MWKVCVNGIADFVGVSKNLIKEYLFNKWSLPHCESHMSSIQKQFINT